MTVQFGKVPGEGTRIGAPVAFAQHGFTVPAIPGGRTGEPLDLGDVQLERRP